MSHFDILVLNEDKVDNNGSSQQQKSMCVRKKREGVWSLLSYMYL